MTEIPLGPLDELPQLRTYSTLLLGFRVVHASDHEALSKRLQVATNILVHHFPYLAGAITSSEETENTLNATKHVIHGKGQEIPVEVNNVRSDSHSYQNIVAANAPASMLDGSIVGLGNGFPDRYTESTPSPCFKIKANFVEGGLLLTFGLLHTIGDGNSLGQVIKMFAIACRGDVIPEADIVAGNVDRQKSIPSLTWSEPQLDHGNMLIKGGDSGDPVNGDDHQGSTDGISMRWAYFRISNSKLIELKAAAAGTSLTEGDKDHISTNDAVTALLWRAITIARLPRIGQEGSTVLMRAINTRRKLDPPLPAETIQNAITATYTEVNLKSFPTIPLSTLAFKLRRDLKVINDHHVRSLATFVRSHKDKNSIGFGACCTPNDVVVSSFASLPVYTSDFGDLLGYPEFVRRPTLTPTDGLAYIMPRSPDGGFDVAVSLRADDMERMELDKDLTYYMECIG